MGMPMARIRANSSSLSMNGMAPTVGGAVSLSQWRQLGPLVPRMRDHCLAKCTKHNVRLQGQSARQTNHGATSWPGLGLWVHLLPVSRSAQMTRGREEELRTDVQAEVNTWTMATCIDFMQRASDNTRNNTRLCFTSDLSPYHCLVA